MKVNDIHRLIDRFFDGTTTLSEEQQLYDYFTSGDVADDLKQYRRLFVGFAMLPETKHKSERRRNIVRRIVGVAASLLLLLGSYTAWNAYENHVLYMSYGGSYMIVDGKRSDNLRKIKSHIENTLSDARDIEHIAAAQPSAADIEQELMDNITDADELARIKKLLN